MMAQEEEMAVWRLEITLVYTTKNMLHLLHKK